MAALFWAAVGGDSRKGAKKERHSRENAGRHSLFIDIAILTASDENCNGNKKFLGKIIKKTETLVKSDEFVQNIEKKNGGRHGKAV
jgi:hypothetical protein